MFNAAAVSLSLQISRVALSFVRSLAYLLLSFLFFFCAYLMMMMLNTVAADLTQLAQSAQMQLLIATDRSSSSSYRIYFLANLVITQPVWPLENNNRSFSPRSSLAQNLSA